jgi:hypothetical protein
MSADRDGSRRGAQTTRRRRSALDQWAEFVQSLAEGKVVPIGKGAAA